MIGEPKPWKGKFLNAGAPPETNVGARAALFVFFRPRCRGREVACHIVSNLPSKRKNETSTKQSQESRKQSHKSILERFAPFVPFRARIWIVSRFFAACLLLLCRFARFVPFGACIWFVSRYLRLACLYFAGSLVPCPLVPSFLVCGLRACTLPVRSFRAVRCLYLLRFCC